MGIDVLMYFLFFSVCVFFWILSILLIRDEIERKKERKNDKTRN